MTVSVFEVESEELLDELGRSDGAECEDSAGVLDTGLLDSGVCFDVDCEGVKVGTVFKTVDLEGVGNLLSTLGTGFFEVVVTWPCTSSATLGDDKNGVKPVGRPKGLWADRCMRGGRG
jgi:hypothetical protein